ncbi:hypothetical protein HYX06_06705 [Candidatus Woesearchaeota archaeon]|nr:hypothetical protein [Candidatus Woesearchaeota archaeon]
MYLFEFNLRTRKASKNTSPEYAVRYLKSKDGLMVEIGDGYRHELWLDAKYWNRIIRIIKNDQLNKSGIQAITSGLMGHCLPKKYEKNLIFAIKKNKIKEIR